MIQACIANFMQKSLCFFDVDNIYAHLYGTNGKKKTFNIVINIENEIFWLKDDEGRDFVLYHILNGLYQCIDCNIQCISGLPKSHVEINEHFGCWIDRPTNSVCFRIAKNGSSQIAKIYSSNGIAFDKSTNEKFVKLQDIDLESISTMTKYVIWRDPLSRVLSQINHFSKMQNLHSHYRKTIIKKLVLNSISNITKFVLANYKVMHYLENKIVNIENDCHLLQQCTVLNRFAKAKIPFDFVVELKRLPQFMENVLGRENTNYSFCGHNTSVMTIEDNELKYFNKLFAYDYAAISKYKNILY